MLLKNSDVNRADSRAALDRHFAQMDLDRAPIEVEAVKLDMIVTPALRTRSMVKGPLADCAKAFDAICLELEKYVIRVSRPKRCSAL